MERTEKLRLSADVEYCHVFKQGLFARLYEQGLYWFSHTIKPLKPMLERVKGGEPVVYGGLPISSLEALIEQGTLQQVETTEYGWEWPYAAQKTLPEETTPFVEWRATVIAAAPPPAVPGVKGQIPGGAGVLAEIAAFNLAAHTPMQAMNAIQQWQESIRGGIQPS